MNELADLLSCVGGLKQTRAVVEKIMQIPEMRQLLPEHMRSSAKDAGTKEIIINEAKVFLTELLGTKGRRTDVNRNAHRGLNLNALLQYPGLYFFFQTAALHCTRVGLATARAWWGGVCGRGWSFFS